MLKPLLLQVATDNEAAYNAGYEIGHFIGKNQYYILGAFVLLIVLFIMNKRRKKSA